MPQTRRNPVLQNDANAPTQRRTYHRILVTFMEYKNSVEYEADKTFAVEEIRTIHPDDIFKWFCFKAYGTENPGDDDNPTLARSTTLEYYKKAISYFMESNGTWDEELRRGNPTKCRQINRLITAVKKKETRRLGKASNADRAFDDDEFSQLVNLLGTQGRLVNRRRFQAMVKFQVHLIGRSDDMAHIQKCNLEESSQFSGFLSVKMRWSKNVHDERDCPKQVILGCFDSTYVFYSNF